MPYVKVAFPVPLRQEFTYEVPEGLKAPLGIRVRASFGRRMLNGYVVETLDNLPADVNYSVKTLDKAVDSEALFDSRLLELAAWISQMYFCSLGEALSAMLPLAKQERDKDKLVSPELWEAAVVPTLSDEQESALAAILEGGKGLYYLHGLTGSGKTEVYLRAALAMAEKGKSTLFLVPEIALAGQTIRAVDERFPGRTAVLHSGLTPSQKLAEWRKIQRGEAQVVVGARSAVFAPLPSIGLIILDEEHESSYKSSNSPRYHARQVAMKRAADTGAALVMGSATPSVEAWHLMQSGALKSMSLTKRLAGGKAPILKIVKMTGTEASISPELHEALIATKEAGKQSILFLNRRGFSYFFHCKTCGYEMTCSRCSVGMTYHRAQDVMICHYCGRVAKPLKICPDCNSLDVGYAGFGTEKVEQDLGKLYPEMRIARLDADSTQKRGSLERTIEDFRSGKTDILLGTQMVAKGLNFPGVSLVGIVNADLGMRMPDFRAAERTFSLITQVAGRAGRYSPDGLVIIQTFRPEAFAIRMAAAGDLAGFYGKEIDSRRELGFPPYSRVIRIVFRGDKEDAVRTFTETFMKKGRAFVPKSAEILGPAECTLSLVNGKFRHHVLFMSKNFGEIHRAVGKMIDACPAPRGLYMEIDTDPVSIL